MKKDLEISVSDYPNNLRHLTRHDRTLTGTKAQFAMDLVKVIGIASHRDKLLFNEEETVARAVKITELAFASFEAKGWVQTAPALDELVSPSSAIGFGGKAA